MTTRVALILRGLFAQLTGDDDPPYRPVILESHCCGDLLLWFAAILLGGTLSVAAHVGALPLSSRHTVLPIAVVQQIVLSSIDVAAELATDTQAGNPLPPGSASAAALP